MLIIGKYCKTTENIKLSVFFTGVLIFQGCTKSIQIWRIPSLWLDLTEPFVEHTGAAILLNLNSPRGVAILSNLNRANHDQYDEQSCWKEISFWVDINIVLTITPRHPRTIFLLSFKSPRFYVLTQNCVLYIHSFLVSTPLEKDIASVCHEISP